MRRIVAVTVVAVLNAAWFFTIGCAARCAFSPCPQQLQPATEERCHHNGQLPPSQKHNHHDSKCPDHSYPIASLVLPAAPDSTPGLQSGSSWVGLAYLNAPAAPQLISLRDVLSHSPPGFSTGRALLQKQALLRI